MNVEMLKGISKILNLRKVRGMDVIKIKVACAKLLLDELILGLESKAKPCRTIVEISEPTLNAMEPCVEEIEEDRFLYLPVVEHEMLKMFKIKDNKTGKLTEAPMNFKLIVDGNETTYDKVKGGKIKTIKVPDDKS